MFPYLSLCKTHDPRGQEPKLDPCDIIGALLVESHYIKPHAKFGNPRSHAYVLVDF